MALLFVTQAATAAPWPQGLSFVALEDGRWQLYVVARGATEPRAVSTEQEPRTPVFDPASGRVAYIGADGGLREQAYDSGTSRELLPVSAERAYTQPAYGPAGRRLYVVALKEGASVDTDILVLDESRDAVKPVVVQRSAQFEPEAPSDSTLYYSNVLCTVGCGKIIQEIWHINLVSGSAEQVTLVNAIARQPTLSADERWLYFSANTDGRFHIWRKQLGTDRYERLTEGNVSDVSPALDADGNLYFIRRAPQSVQLMRLSANGELRPLPLPSGATDVRDLEIGR